MKFFDKPIQEPWAYAHRKDFTGTEQWRNYRYFRTRKEAEQSIKWMERKGRWHGPIEYRPGESAIAGYAITW